MAGTRAHCFPTDASETSYLLDDGSEKFGCASSIDQPMIERHPQIRPSVFSRTRRRTQENHGDGGSNQNGDTIRNVQPRHIIDVQCDALTHLIFTSERPANPVLDNGDERSKVQAIGLRDYGRRQFACRLLHRQSQLEMLELANDIVLQ